MALVQHAQEASGTAAVAEAVSPGRGAFVDELVRLTQAEVQELDHDVELTRLLRASIEENVSRLLDILATGADPRARPPYGALEYARRVGSSHASLGSLLRAYRIGQARFTEHCLEAAATLRPPVAPSDQIAVVHAISAYLDHVCEQVTPVYEAEHEGWLRSVEGAREQALSRLLSEEPLPGGSGPEELSAALGYDVAGDHVAFVVWTGPEVPPGHRKDVLTRTVCQVKSLLGSDREALSLEHSASERWVWLHPARRPECLGESLGGDPGVVRIAGGAPATGMHGFRQSHRQALRVKGLMGSARHAPSLAHWSEVAGVAALVADEDVARTLARDVLGELAGNGERVSELRETLRTFLETNRSHTAAASRLHLHRNTVGYRVEQARQICRLDPFAHEFAVRAALELQLWRPGLDSGEFAQPAASRPDQISPS